MLQHNADKPRNFYQEVSLCIAEYLRLGTNGWHKEVELFRDTTFADIAPSDHSKLKEKLLEFSQTLRSTYNTSVGETTAWALSYIPGLPNGSTLKAILESIANDIPEQPFYSNLFSDDDSLPFSSEESPKASPILILKEKLKRLTTKSDDTYQGYSNADRGTLIEQMQIYQKILESQKSSLLPSEDSKTTSLPKLLFNQKHWEQAQLPLLVDHMLSMKLQMKQNHAVLNPKNIN